VRGTTGAAWASRRLPLRSAALLTFVVTWSAPADDPGDVGSENLGRVSAELDAVASFGTNTSQLKMYKHAPAKVPAGPRPLVVVLHGCTQTAAAYESAGWSDLADEWGFYVLYPEQNTTRLDVLRGEVLRPRRRRRRRRRRRSVERRRGLERRRIERRRRGEQ
jgi:poly(3-hydroxybutyrate) depolymerase